MNMIEAIIPISSLTVVKVILGIENIIFIREV